MVRKLSEAMDQSNVDPAVIQACLAEYTTLDTEIKRLAQRQAAMFRRYEGQGVVVKSLKNAHRMSKLDKAAAAAQAKTDVRYLVITGVLKPADSDWVRQVSQSDMFAADEEPDTVGKPSPDLARARAHSDGYNSGRHGGEAINNPFQAGQAEFVAWEQGRTDGAADRALRSGGSGKGKTANASPSKRGRPAGSRNRPKSNGQDAHV
jgi:hypothetical protein